MNRPYIICHMMMSVDGRIDCGMTVKMAGTREYDETLALLDAPAGLSGRVTAQLEMAEPGLFHAENAGDTIGREAFSQKRDADNDQVVVDTMGTLRWKDDRDSDAPLLVILSEAAPREYSAFLDALGIS